VPAATRFVNEQGVSQGAHSGIGGRKARSGRRQVVRANPDKYRVYVQMPPFLFLQIVEARERF
jgi:hypothetical protein